MNGDEDLGQDIIMKGEKFHYAQNKGKYSDPVSGMEGHEEVYGPAIVGGNPVKYHQKGEKTFLTISNYTEEMIDGKKDK